ncbi:hypothetical protein [Thalassospira mesophila]|uniref:Uncharacterized protein n=1 Tax=Thalassospira mesophila TaxID=1293891 RepID=A0A1Y2L0C0_9PROT|nr:hypothetical protein [Thalassospira mesophila]OSQ38264.1 hypothetical protein TMES_10240 [Thalassospira mesophila]
MTDPQHAQPRPRFSIKTVCIVLGTTIAALAASPARAQTSAPASTATPPGQTTQTSPAPKDTQPPAPAPRCNTRDLALCEDTNQLIWSEGFADAVGAFVGAGNADWLYKNGSKIDQVIAVLGGPPQVRQKIGNDLWLYGACRAHSCPEKGAIVLGNDGTIKAAAILHFSCGDTCADDYTLTIMGPDDKTLSDDMESWAKTTLADDARAYKQAKPPKIAKVEHIAAAGARKPATPGTNPAGSAQTPAPLPGK